MGGGEMPYGCESIRQDDAWSKRQAIAIQCDQVVADLALDHLRIRGRFHRITPVQNTKLTIPNL